MKKFFMAVALALVSVCASAQGFGGQFNPEDMAKRQATMLKDSCALDTAQYSKVLNLYVEQSKEMMKMMQDMQNGGGGMGGFDMGAMQKRQEDFDKKLKAVLTEEQFKKYQVMQENRRKRMQQMMQGGGGFGGGFGQ